MARRSRWRLIAWCLLLQPVAASAQGTAEIVRGRITDLKQQPVPDATVIVTGGMTQLVRTTHTDKDGHYSTFFLDAEGSYTVLVRKIGYTPANKRVSRTGLSNTVTADVVIAASAYPLEPLSVTAPRLGGATAAERPSIGGMDQNLLAGGNFLLDPSDLNGLALLTAGVYSVGDSAYSVLGASSEQNSTLLDGMNFTGGNLPPDAACSMSLATTTSDPSRGQFAGGQTSIGSCRGRDYAQSTIRGTLVNPSLTWSDPGSPTSPATVGTTSGFISGPLQKGKAHYRLSFTGTDRATDAPSLLAPRAALLPQLGLLPDTIAAVASALNGLHAPLTSSAVPSDVQGLSGSVFLNMDWSLGAATSFLFTAQGSLNQSNGAGLSPSAFPSTTSQSTRRNGQVMLRGSTYAHGVIDELTTVVSGSSNQFAPYVMLPSGSVVVGTEYADGQTSLTSLRFGGGSSSSHSSTREWNTKNQFSWSARGGAHQLSFGQQLTLDWNTSLQAANTLGTFAYQTLASLEANAPASYTRTLDATERSNHYASEAFWLGDTWRASKALSFEGGLRVDAAQFATKPEYNPSVDTIFGRRTDQVPSDFGISPRLGFAWLVKKQGSRKIKDPRTGQMIMVDVIDLSDLTGAARGNTGAGITLYGSLGANRGVIPPNRVAALVDRTGLPGTTRTLSCVGAATPIPDWSTSNGALFTDCLDGTAPGAFSGNQAVVSLLDPSYRAPLDWKGNLGLTGLRLGNWYGTTGVVFDHEVNVESRIDLNLQRTVGFTLASEGNRPVYVSADNIVPQTGVLAPNANRISSQYGQVINTVSDLHRDAAQLNVTVNPPRIFNKLSLQFTYSFNPQRSEQRGFQSTTAGDPFAIETVAGAQPLHQFIMTTSTLRLWWFLAGIRLNVLSGIAYTPTVVGDINGDGLSNDRAFVASPPSTPDAALAAQMSTLLAQAPGSARACLQAQLGQIAAANSCRGPWRTRLDFTLNFAPPQGVGLGDRLHLTTRFINAGAAVMRIFGVNSALAQGSASPDGRLLYVTGFDPAAQRFQYQVNQAFGQPLDFGLGNHRFPPFQLQVGLEYKLAAAPTNPYLRSLGLAPNKKAPRTADDVNRGLQRTLLNPVDTILALRDSLVLTPDQVTKLQAIAATYHRITDSLRGPVATYVLQRGLKLTDSDMSTQTARLFNAILSPRTQARDQSLAILTPDQKTRFAAIQTNSRRAPLPRPNP